MNIKKRKISFNAKMVILLIVIFLLPTLVLFSIEYFAFRKNLQESTLSDARTAEDAFNTYVDSEIEKMSSTLEVLVNDETIKELFMAREKHSLYSACYPAFLNMQNEFGIDKWYFIEKEPESKCFLQVHNYADTCGKVERYTYLETVATKKTSSGLEPGNATLLLRVVNPYFSENTLLGYMELAEDIEDFIEYFRPRNVTDVALLAKKDFLDRKEWESITARSISSVSWDDNEDFAVIARSEGIKLPGSITIGDIRDQINIIGIIEKEDRRFNRVTIPIYDAGGNKVGGLLFDIDVYDVYHDFYHVLGVNIGIIFTTCLLLGIILFFSIRNFNKDLRLARFEAERSALKARKADEAKSSFLANMSHEIRTPMNAIIGFSEILRERIEDSSLKKYTDTIVSSGKTLLGLINDILDLSKIEAGRMEIQYNPVDPKALFSDIAKLFSLKVEEKGLKLLSEIDVKLPDSILIDEVRIRQVLFNLVGNAVKFTSEGYVELKVKGVFYDDRSKIDLIFSVKDTGIGISKEDQEKIFDSFSQSKGQDNKKYGGTGLGLAITKRLVELMNGEMTVESTVGKGSIFKVTLKEIAVSAITGKVAKEMIDFDNIKFKGQTILITDDIESNRLLLKESLSMHKLHSIEATNGKEAIFMAINHKPDLILMDLRMPVMDGYEAIERIKADDNLKDIPVIILTASAMQEEVEKVEKVKSEGYIRKPISRKELLEVLMKYLKHESTKETKDKKATVARPLQKKEGKKIKTEDLKKVLKTLDGTMKEKWEKVKNESILEDIEDFAVEIKEIGEESGLSTLTKWADEIIAQAGDFDMDNLSKTLEKYKDIIDGLKKGLGADNAKQ